ncbi:hypothetical protein D3C79_672300 [compost metagenome]
MNSGALHFQQLLHYRQHLYGVIHQQHANTIQAALAQWLRAPLTLRVLDCAKGQGDRKGAAQAKPR